MAPETPRDLRHIYLPQHGQAGPFIPRGSGRAKLGQWSEERGLALRQSLGRALEQAGMRLAEQDDTLSRRAPGFYLEFELSQLESKALEGLEDRRGKMQVEVVAVRKRAGEEGVIATVFVPKEKEGYFSKKLEQYLAEVTPKGNRKHLGLVPFIEGINIGDARSLYTGFSAFPSDGAERWWEVWLRRDMREHFEANARRLNIRLNDHHLQFAEREVLLALATPEVLDHLIRRTDAIAELRLASDNPFVFLGMRPEEQREWAADLAGRVDPPSSDAPAVCVLDSGTTLRHPLLKVALDPADQQAYLPDWSIEDTSRNGHGGHGTEMSGLALYGDLVMPLEGSDRVALIHRLESVKILPDRGENEPRLYGHITGACIAKAEIQAPQRPRAVCLAVTSPDGEWRGRPSSWSAALDQLAFGPERQRLVVVSAGNVDERLTPENYLDVNDRSAIENPAQAWNVLTVGAYTEKANVTDPTYHGWEPLGVCGDLSPCSRTSVRWEPKWPIKPDVVFEGGTLGVDPSTGAGDHVDDLALLTTFRNPEERPFTTTRDTSAATALAARMAAEIMADLMANGQSDPWPETIRALMVHSAEWTEAMRAHLPPRPRQQDWSSFLRRYGYGVPSLERALRSLRSDVTLVIEKTFQPFRLHNGSVKMGGFIQHDLPWPRQALEDLGEAEVEMRVTLSYFVEPNPGERGWVRRHRYASYGLRFRVKRQSETESDFLQRINKAVQEEEEGVGGEGESGSTPDSREWTIGSNLQTLGSIHSTLWRGTAAELAAKQLVAVFPAGGWWKEKKYLERYAHPARYSLIVTLRVPSAVVDLYTPILNQIPIPVEMANL